MQIALNTLDSNSIHYLTNATSMSTTEGAIND